MLCDSSKPGIFAHLEGFCLLGFYSIQMGLVLGDPLGVRDLNGGLSDQGSCVYFVIALVGYSE